MIDIEYKKIDHLAVAVCDLELGIKFYRDVLGMKLLERRETKGNSSGMISAVMDAGSFTIVLMQGTEESSQISKYINRYGPGVQHVAFEVDNIEEATAKLSEAGSKFSTDLIHSGQLKQMFSVREANSGMMFEIIERTGESGFKDSNINNLFQQLEENDNF